MGALVSVALVSVWSRALTVSVLPSTLNPLL